MRCINLRFTYLLLLTCWSWKSFSFSASNESGKIYLITVW